MSIFSLNRDRELENVFCLPNNSVYEVFNKEKMINKTVKTKYHFCKIFTRKYTVIIREEFSYE